MPILLLLLFLSTDAQAQEPACDAWWCEWGMPRNEVEKMYEKQEGYGFGPMEKNENGFCYEWDLMDRRVCNFFSESGKLESHTETHKSASVNDLGKEMNEIGREWGNPVAYYADQSEVSSWDQAVRLADRKSKVVYYDERSETILELWVRIQDQATDESSVITFSKWYKKR